jgi:PEP-CTERM motif-containing protein
MRVATWMITAGLLIGAQTLTAGQVFFSDFESGTPAEVGGYVNRASTEQYPTFAPSFSNWFLWNDTTGNPASPTTLTLTGLPAHTFLDISFMLAVIDSWDGTGAGPDGPDFFNVKVDGSPVFSGAYNNTNAGDPYSGTRLFFNQEAGFNSSFGDSAYSLALKGIAHTTSTATIEFFASGAGWAGLTDESWAVDNLDVSTSSVPEPSSILLLFSGAAAIFVRRRK